MNATEKLELQVTEAQDGSATVNLPPGEEVENEAQPQDLPQNDQNEGENEAAEASDNLDDDPDREAIRAQRREERKLKKQIHREKAKESNHLINALKKQNQDLAERLSVMERKTSGAELARVDKAIEDAGVQRLAADWMDRNPWYDPHGKDLDSEITQRIDKKLTEEGYDPTTEDYWDELDDRIKKYVPHKSSSEYNQTNVRNQRPRSVVTSSGRDSTATTKSNEFRLSPDRVAAIKEAGMWDNAELRQKAIRNYAAWDRTNKARG